MFEIPVSVSLPNLHFPSNLSLLFKYYVPSIKILRKLIKKKRRNHNHVLGQIIFLLHI